MSWLSISKKQGIARGAMILATAGIIVKIIGACFKIPLGAILKPEGMANFSIAYNIYALLFVLSTAGVPVAVSKMIAEARATGRGHEVSRIYRLSLVAFAGVSLAASAGLFLGADMFARLMGSATAAPAIAAIAPAIFIVAISSITRGYFQGNLNMMPTAFSEVIEALGKMIIGLACAWWLDQSGFDASHVAAGAVVGVSAGAMLAAVYLQIAKKREWEAAFSKHAPSRSTREILKELMHLAIPITIGAAVISLTNVIDSALVMNLLQKIGFTARKAMWLYGSYNYAANLFNLPSVLITTIGVSLIPAVSGAFAQGARVRLCQTIESTMKLAMLMSFAASFGMSALAEPIVYLLYGGSLEAEAVRAAGFMLRILALAVPALSVVTLTNAIHQAVSNVRLPVISMLAGAV
ncbi:MAG: polysaccharide biosynthesis protein, partial [Clostridia bacterium]